VDVFSETRCISVSNHLARAPLNWTLCYGALEVSVLLLLLFGREFDHMTHDLNLIHAFKVKGSKFKVTALHNVSAAKNAVSQERIGWRSSDKDYRSCSSIIFGSDLTKIIPELMATRDTCLRSLGQILKSQSAADCLTALKCGIGLQSLNTAQPVYYKCSRSKIKCLRHSVT